MPKIIKFVFFLLLLATTFEAGLLSSYVIVTAQPPNVGNVINMQVNDLTSIWNNIHKSSFKAYNVTNSESVASVLQNKTGMDTIDISTLSATAVSTHGSNLNITLEITGYKDNETTSNSSSSYFKKSAFTSGQIVITPSAEYNLTATATATMDTTGIDVNVSTIKITAMQQIANQ